MQRALIQPHIDKKPSILHTVGSKMFDGSDDIMRLYPQTKCCPHGT